MNTEENNTQLPQSSVSVSVMDLRIGNKLLIKGKVITVNWQEMKWIQDGDKSYSPIHITEKLLLKIGAIKLDFKDFPSFNLVGTQINFVNGIWIDYATRVEVKGLHHLQNIFFFRNSEELQISCLTEH